ncbi:tyrosine-type recombinase/integrase [Corynebacterium glutamicum]|uniref:tyrosine-type recombinase/integrase n=1 Tax=Corynebacterium glutamicum TaxID=1718 RepID=UPI001465419A|nr:site-specific integrase [Corynebacterium glutamicum]GFK18914.1 hypothetical protein KbCgl_14860 [Corynebacterium glutamicum]
MAENPRKKTLKSGKISWEARYRDPTGQQRSKSFPLKKEAVAFLEEERRRIRRGEWLDPKTHTVTVGELMDMWADRPVREGTAEAYRLTRKNLGPLADLPASKLTRSDVDAWHRQLTTGRPWMSKHDTGLAQSSAREHVVRLSAALNGAVDDGTLLRNPVKLPRLSEAQQVLRSDIPDMDTIRDVVTMLQNGGARFPSRERVAGHRGQFRPVTRVQEPQVVIADMVRTAIGTGMRLSELCGLRVEDVDFLRREVRVEAPLAASGAVRVPTKTLSSVRTIPIADDLVEVLDRRAAASTEGWLFETNRGTPYRAATAGGELRKTVTHLNAGVTFHSFRHLYASRLISSGVSVKQVQTLMGHASAATTLDIYSHFFPGDDDVSRNAIFGVVESLKILRRFSENSDDTDGDDLQKQA